VAFYNLFLDKNLFITGQNKQQFFWEKKSGFVCMYVFHCWSWDQKCSQPVKAVSSISDMPW
jgi:hypothetical protein